MSLQAPKLDRTITSYIGNEITVYYYDPPEGVSVELLYNDQVVMTHTSPQRIISSGFFNSTDLFYAISYTLISADTIVPMGLRYKKDSETSDITYITFTRRQGTETITCIEDTSSIGSANTLYNITATPVMIDAATIDKILWFKADFVDANGTVLFESNRIKARFNNGKFEAQVAYADNSTPAAVNIYYRTSYGWAARSQITLTSVTTRTARSSDSWTWTFSIYPWSIGINLAANTPYSTYTWKLIASDQSNFSQYEVITPEFTLSTQPNHIDYAANMATTRYYKLIQVKNESGASVTSGAITATTSINIPAVLDNIYLARMDKAIALKYNPDLTNLKWNYADTVTPTLGGVYPVIRRNGSQRYRTFTIGGMLSYAIEDTRSFLTTTQYNTIQNSSHSALDKEVLYERYFRDAVLTFLYEDTPLIFKSAEEGAMLVRLSGISLTPEKSLGRRIYSFSATATEIAECTSDNIRKYFDLTAADYSTLIYDYYFAVARDATTLIGAQDSNNNNCIVVTRVRVEV